MVLVTPRRHVLPVKLELQKGGELSIPDVASQGGAGYGFLRQSIANRNCVAALAQLPESASGRRSGHSYSVSFARAIDCRVTAHTPGSL
jgi:hypothetical protein